MTQQLPFVVEVRGGVASANAAEFAVVKKPGFSAHLENVPLVGSKRPTRILTATGKWFVGNTPIASFQGTSEGGTGGPAALPFGPTGTGVFAAGQSRSGTSGADKFRAEHAMTLASGVTYTLYARKKLEISFTGATWTTATKTITKVAAFANYTNGMQATVYIATGQIGSPASTVDLHAVVATKTSDDAITLATDIGVDNGATDVVGSLAAFTAWQNRAITSVAATYAATAELTLASGFTAFYTGDTGILAQGDPYYIQASDADIGDDAPETMPTISAALCGAQPWFPYQTFSRQTALSITDFSGVATVPASAAGTDMAHYWWGLWTIPPEAFVNGDEYVIRIAGDYTHGATNAIIECLLIPNFDPLTDWDFAAATQAGSRLAAKVAAFQSDAISTSGTFPLDIEIRMKSGARQTSGGNFFPINYKFNLQLGPVAGSSGGQGCAALTLETKRAMATSITQTLYNWRTKYTRMTLLMKIDAATLLTKPGYHGYYAGEPFSTTTGLGGVVLAQNGASTVAGVTKGSRARISCVTVDQFPGGSY